MEEVTATEARRRVYELVRRARDGERFLIVYGRNKKPVGILEPTSGKRPRKNRSASEPKAD